MGMVALLDTKVKEENIDMVANKVSGRWSWSTNV